MNESTEIRPTPEAIDELARRLQLAKAEKAAAAEIFDAVDIRSTYTKLAAAASSQDTATAAAAVQNLRQILTKAGYSPAADASANDLLTMFRQAMADAAQSDDKLKSLSDAVAGANIK